MHGYYTETQPKEGDYASHLVFYLQIARDIDLAFG